jgi:hypothetical protein
MKKILSILAVATMATPIILVSSPAQALTWDDFWGAIQKGVVQGVQAGAESAIRSNMPEQSNISNDGSEKVASEQPDNASDGSEAEQVSE